MIPVAAACGDGDGEGRGRVQRFELRLPGSGTCTNGMCGCTGDGRDTDECCPKVCVGGVCNAGCITVGNTCTANTDCCGGYCDPQTLTCNTVIL